VSGAYCLENEVFTNISKAFEGPCDLADTHYKFWIGILGDPTASNVALMYFLPHAFNAGCDDGCYYEGVSIRLQPRPPVA